MNPGAQTLPRVVPISAVGTLRGSQVAAKALSGSSACGSASVAIDLTRLLSSPDFVTWTVRHEAFPLGSLSGALAWGAGKFVAIGNLTSTDGRVSVSSDGIKWTDTTVPFINARAVWDGTQFVLTSRGNLGRPVLATSPDAAAWTYHAFADPPGVASGAATGAGLTVVTAILGSRGALTNVQRTIWTSPDLSTWTYRLNPFDYDGGGNEANASEVWDVAWNGSMFVAVGRSSWNAGPTFRSIATSSDGISWTARPSPLDGGVGHSVTWDGSAWIVVGDGPEPFSTGGLICTSPDGIAWTLRLVDNPHLEPDPTFFAAWDVDARVLPGGAPGVALVAGTPFETNPPFAHTPDGATWVAPSTNVDGVGFLSVALGPGGTPPGALVVGDQQARLLGRGGQ